MKEIVFVGLGGAFGAILRYLISVIPYKSTFPVHTFLTNIAGALIIGLVIGLIEADFIPLKHHALFWKTGFCGGLTTFSTFSFESLSLIEDKCYSQAGVYIVASVICCLIGVFIGKTFSKLVVHK